jgi:hypothetical protein
MAKQLIEDAHSSLPFLREEVLSGLTLVEDTAVIKGKEVRIVKVKGEFARSGIATENGRLYPGQLWEREINRLSPRFEGKQCYGELDHPEDGKTKLSRASHVITSLSLKGNQLIGEAEILPTTRGRDLMVFFDRGCKVGVSSRGYGSTKPNEKGEDVVQEDYKLVAFDFVADPADQTAYPQVVSEASEAGRFLFEGVEFEMKTETTQNIEEDKSTPEKEPETKVEPEKKDEQNDADTTAIDAAVEKAQKEAKEHFKKEYGEKLVSELGKIKAELEEKVRKEYLAQATVSESSEKSTALDEVCSLLRPFLAGTEGDAVLSEKEEEIAELKKEITKLQEQVTGLEDDNLKLAQLARNSGFTARMEQVLRDNPDADSIRRLVGEVSEFKSAEEFMTRLESAAEEINKVRLEEEKAATEQREFQEQVNAEKAELNGRVTKLEEALGKSLEALKLSNLYVYAERRITAHPRSAQIRALLEKSTIEEKEDVDEIIEQFRAPTRSREEIEATAARIRGSMGGGVGRVPFDEEEPWPTAKRKAQQAQPQALTEGKEAKALTETEDFNGLGISLESIMPLMPPEAD